MARRTKVEGADPGLDPLTELAIRHGTDKYGPHDYTPNYWKLFRDWRDRPVRLLEIGVGGYGDALAGGESLAMWRDFFPNGQITGIDIQAKNLDLGERVAIREGSQVDTEFLAAVCDERGPFDIIIDDGSHQNIHVIQSFEFLFPKLAMPGIYVVEDTQTAFFPRFGGSPDPTGQNSLAYFARLFVQIDHVEADAMHHTGLHPTARFIRSIERFHNIVALHKGDNTYPSNFRMDGTHPSVRQAIGDIVKVNQADLPEKGHIRAIRFLSEIGEKSSADAILERLLRAGASGKAFRKLAIAALDDQGRHAEADAIVASARFERPQDVEFLFWEAARRTRANDLKGAVVSLREAETLAPRSPGVLARLSAAELASGEIGAGLSTARKLAKIRKSKANAHLVLATALLANDLKSEAREALQRVLALEPDNQPARQLLDQVGGGSLLGGLLRRGRSRLT